MASIFRNESRRSVGSRPLRWNTYLLRLVAAIAGLLVLGCAAWAIDDEIDEHRAVSALREGGHIVFFRHAERFKGAKERLSEHSTPAEFADCSRQRNLTPEGREQARLLGEYFRELDIPVGQVISNAQCRTRDTALLAFGKTRLEPGFYNQEFLRGLLAAPPQAGTNTILVGNDYPFDQLTGIDLARAEAAIIRPDGKGGYDVVARLDFDDWTEEAEPGWW
ncbi:MAG: histidine phosphatase family protein [Rhodospirillaceae bacterium]|nr:histidine phosphatase family protein [Rhodospirillaceae bacterium]